MNAYYFIASNEESPEVNRRRYKNLIDIAHWADVTEGVGIWHGETELAWVCLRSQGLPVLQLKALIELAGSWEQDEVFCIEGCKLGLETHTIVMYPDAHTAMTDAKRQDLQAGFISNTGTLNTTEDFAPSEKTRTLAVVRLPSVIYKYHPK